VAAIRRAGRIIRAAFLDRIRGAYDARRDLPGPLADKRFAEEVGAAQDDWREVVAAAARQGVPAPGFAAALAYYDALRAERLPAALAQGRCDFSVRTPAGGPTGRVRSTPSGAATARR
jgi:6-phosphogluconate dehydrogenase